MKTIQIKKGINIPLQGAPAQTIQQGPTIRHIALLGQDYLGLKPGMVVQEGDRIKKGQLLFTDKANPGIKFTAPACGIVKKIIRGPKRKFNSLVIAIDGDDSLSFPSLADYKDKEITADSIKDILTESGMWRCFRTRPFGRIPAVNSQPSSLFVTAIDTNPLAADPLLVIKKYSEAFSIGLQMLSQMLDKPVYLCLGPGGNALFHDIPKIISYEFHGPHPAGLPSTHIHFLDPVHSGKTVWHIGYQDVIAIGKLFQDGVLFSERIISLAGPGALKPCLLKTHIGADITELCSGNVQEGDIRFISGSVLNGDRVDDTHGYLGHFHNQVSLLFEGNGRGFLSWLSPGLNRFSTLPLFLSSLVPGRSFAMNTAEWGGRRAIFPLGTYEKVMPLDIMITVLLKSLAVGDTTKSKTLGCLELIEEDMALCSFVCPGKNNFGPMLRNVLARIEAGE
jgi:Na+-transporting NADH:ubiquinone oxidoreductase subunit A